MTTEQIFTTITVGLTSVNVLLTYFNLRHSRKKEFQDKLFQFKIGAYKTLNDAYYSAVKRLDVNSTPYVEIYNYTDEKEWVKYCEANMGTEIIEGFKLQDLVYGQAMYLPRDVVDKFYDFTNDCISFVTHAYHFDTGLIISNHDRLWDKYIELLNLIRKDLNIELIDTGLKHRISSRM
jgi:hypothetical protein